MPEPSALGPIDPGSIHDPSVAEEEKAAPWIMRKLIGVSAAFRSGLAWASAWLCTYECGSTHGHGVHAPDRASERRTHCGSRAHPRRGQPPCPGPVTARASGRSLRGVRGVCPRTWRAATGGRRRFARACSQRCERTGECCFYLVSLLRSVICHECYS